MSKIGKRFDISFSKKFPDGHLLSITFGTYEEQELRDDISFADIDKAKSILSQRLRENTIEDIRLAKKTDPLVRSAWKDLITNIKREEKVERAEKENA